MEDLRRHPGGFQGNYAPAEHHRDVYNRNTSWIRTFWELHDIVIYAPTSGVIVGVPTGVTKAISDDPPSEIYI